MKRTASAMEGDADDEEEVLGEGDADPDAEDDGEEVAGQQIIPSAGVDDIDEDDDYIEDDGESLPQPERSQEQKQQHEEEQPEPPANLMASDEKVSLKNNGVGSDDEDDKTGPSARAEKTRDDEEDDEENLDIELGKSQNVDTERMQTILAQFTSEQMSRYECYRRSGFQKSNMRRLLQSVAGCTISMPMTIVMSGIAKMFVGELVEMARIVMTERRETGPTRPCHIREAYRRLKLKGKVPLKTRPRLFH